MSIVVLSSGGLDSSLISIMSKEQGIACRSLFVNYGQICAESEWEACKEVHLSFNLGEPTYLDLSGYGQVIRSGLTDSSLDVNLDAFLPGRNHLFLLAGAAFACQTGSSAVAVGLLNPSAMLFPDQSPEFVAESEPIISKAVGQNIKFILPLIEMSKAQVMALAESYGLTETYSCHSGTETPCGVCISCTEALNSLPKGQ